MLNSVLCIGLHDYTVLQCNHASRAAEVAAELVTHPQASVVEWLPLCRPSPRKVGRNIKWWRRSRWKSHCW